MVIEYHRILRNMAVCCKESSSVVECCSVSQNALKRVVQQHFVNNQTRFEYSFLCKVSQGQKLQRIMIQ